MCFHTLPGEVLSLMLMVNYLTMNPFSGEEGKGTSGEEKEEIIWITLTE